MPRAYIPDSEREFWPSGWLVWASAALCIFDLCMVINLIRLVVTR